VTKASTVAEAATEEAVGVPALEVEDAVVTALDELVVFEVVTVEDFDTDEVEDREAEDTGETLYCAPHAR
jgi:hypothetical protein